REIDAPRRVPVRPAAGVTPVQPDVRVRHGAVDLQRNPLAGVLRAELEMFAIPPDARPRQLAGFARIFLLERPLDAPVVREIEMAPAAVVKIRPRVGDVFAEVPLGSRLNRLRRG